MNAKWKINGLDTQTEYGLSILEGSYLEIMSPPQPRERLQYDFPDRDGAQVDVNSPMLFKSRTFTINILLVGANRADFWRKYKKFWETMFRPGSFALEIADLGITLNLLYEGAVCTKKPRSLQSGRVAVAYELSLKEVNPKTRTYHDIDI